MDELVFLDLDDVDDDDEKDFLLEIIKSQQKNPDIVFPWDYYMADNHKDTKPREITPSLRSVTGPDLYRTQNMAATQCDMTVFENVDAQTRDLKSRFPTNVIKPQGKSSEADSVISDFIDSTTENCTKLEVCNSLDVHSLEKNMHAENNITDYLGNDDQVTMCQIISSSSSVTPITSCCSDSSPILFMQNSLLTEKRIDTVPSKPESKNDEYLFNMDGNESSPKSVSNGVSNASSNDSEQKHVEKQVFSESDNSDKVVEFPSNGNSSITVLLDKEVTNKWNSSRTFADVVRNKPENESSKSEFPKVTHMTSVPIKPKTTETDSMSHMPGKRNTCIEDDKFALILGSHLLKSQIDFSPVCLQPRGLINRRNWCYINATLQALIACCPFYNLLRNIPVGSGTDRGKSSTPVTDCMVSLACEFEKLSEPQEQLQQVAPLQPIAVYETLGILKSDCLKGQQEDAEEFLSYILNGMHEEMVHIIKNYEAKCNLSDDSSASKSDDNVNEDQASDEDEWQVIGAKHKGMITRRVFEHKTPISDLLGGEIKSILSATGNRTACVQPFFTLPLDIQSENVSSLEEALDQMAAKEAIQGYTCSKTNKEVEAYSQVVLQKLPPILILSLKRFLYNVNGGCKKAMKHTEYPMTLELKKDWIATETRRRRQPVYKLFAVVYHDGEEAVKGHYICDAYCHGSNGWIRCDDRSISSITANDVISHSPPRVPYILFYEAERE